MDSRQKKTIMCVHTAPSKCPEDVAVQFDSNWLGLRQNIHCSLLEVGSLRETESCLCKVVSKVPVNKKMSEEP